MMARWGLYGMQSFQQPGVAMKEGDRLKEENDAQVSDKGAVSTRAVSP